MAFKLIISSSLVLGLSAMAFSPVPQEYSSVPKIPPKFPTRLTVEEQVQRAVRTAVKDANHPLIDEPLIWAMISVESRGIVTAKRVEEKLVKRYRSNPKFKSWAKDAGSSHGLMQLLGSTALDMGLSVPELYNPVENVHAGVKYAAGCARKEKSRFRVAACYNAGWKRKYPEQALKHAKKVMEAYMKLRPIFDRA